MHNNYNYYIINFDLFTLNGTNNFFNKCSNRFYEYRKNQ